VRLEKLLEELSTEHGDRFSLETYYLAIISSRIKVFEPFKIFPRLSKVLKLMVIGWQDFTKEELAHLMQFYFLEYL